MKKAPDRETKPMAFVMMPFKNTDLVRAAIKNACTIAGFDCGIIDEGNIIDKVTVAIEEKIRSADVCICDVTNKNPNVAWEFGFAKALEKKVILLTQSDKHLYFDIKDYSAIIYDLKIIESTLIQPLAKKLANIDYSDFLPHELAQTRSNISLMLAACATNIQQTPYSVFELIEKARERIFLAGQNLGFITQTEISREKFRKALVKFLDRSKNTQFEIMICDENCRHAILTWIYVTEANEYERHLRESIDYFKELTDYIQSVKKYKGRFSVKQFDFVPLSISFIDPENDKTGLAVVTPNAFQRSNNYKPAYILSMANNREIVRTYWHTYYHYYTSMPSRPLK